MFKQQFVISLLTCLIIGSSIALSQPALQWMSFTEEAQKMRAVTTDTQGNIFVGGVVNYYGDYFVAKYNSVGDTIWTAVYNYGQWDYLQDIAVDESGNVYATGRSQLSGAGYDIVTVSFDPSGTLRWSQRQLGFGASNDAAGDMTIDSEGNLIVVGGVGTENTGTTDIATLKYSSDGILIWSRFHDENSGNDGANKVVLDENDNIYIIGSADNNYCTLKYSADGTLLWVNTYDGPQNSLDWGNAIALDSENNVYVTGAAYVANSHPDIATIKYDSSGSEEWVQLYGCSGMDNGSDSGYQIAADIDGNIIVAGESDSWEYADDIVILKYNPDGQTIWEERYTASGGYESQGVKDMILDEAGSIYLVGNSNESNYNLFKTLKYASDGQLLWEETHDYPECSYSAGGYALTLDPVGNVIAAGLATYYGPDTIKRLLLLKYRQDGIVYTELNLIPDEPSIQIPQTGGGFSYTFNLSNYNSATSSMDVWIDVIMPDEDIYSPLLGPIQVDLAVGSTLTRQRDQYVPPNAPPGEYKYIASAGYYLYTIFSSDTIYFEKLGSEDGAAFSPSEFYVEPFAGEETIQESKQVSQESCVRITPNPFNPVTTFNIQLPTSGRVNLSIFDIGGRKVATLIDGFRNGGVHQVTFDATGLPSGIYLYKIETENYTSNGRIVLLK